MVIFKKLAILALVLIAFAFALSRAASWNVSSGFSKPPVPQIQQADPVVVVQAAQSRKRGHHQSRRDEEAIAVKGRFDTRFASSKLHTQTHAASLVELKDGCTSDTLLAKPADCGRRCNAATPAPEGSAPSCHGRIRAFWFSGSREGAADVTINSAVFDTALNQWGEEKTVAGRDSTQRGLNRYVAKVGNPVATRAPDGSLWLFYVTVSLGGWAGSSITLITSSDEGESWSEPRRLVTSPFMNVSTLVKGTPFRYADGTIGLPVYHEFIGKFAEILHLDRTGKVLDKQRLAAGGQGTLQPVVLVRNEQEALVLTRYSGSSASKHVQRIATDDGGRSWQAVQSSTLHNPDAAITGLVLSDGKILAVLNDKESGRESLSLQLSADGGNTWRELRRLEEMSALGNKKMDERACLALVENLLRSSDPKFEHADGQNLAGHTDSAKGVVRTADGCHFEFSYPYVIQAHNGDIHVVYTWNRTFIKHVVFDQAWLQLRLQEPRP